MITGVFRQVPVLPVVVPLGVVVLLGLLQRLRRRGGLTAPRAAVALAVAVYAAGVVANTVFPLYRDKPAADLPWHAALVLVPFAEYEVADAVQNVLVFVPLGILVALLLARPTAVRTTAVGALVSLAVEVIQYVTAHVLGAGHVADASDLVCNTAGALLGYGLLAAAVRVPVLARLVARFRRPGDDGHVRPDQVATRG
jgi:glycopeptide antibiotics resistance protein